jgi:hypothetical protein
VDGGATWNFQTFGSDDSFTRVQFVNENIGWVVGGSNTEAIVLHTTDGGANWASQPAGTSNYLSGMFFVDENNGWAVGFDGTIIHTTDGGLVGIGDAVAANPAEFVLYDNYPNPFNPTTNIRFKIANPGFVSLKVYDVFGREVATLVNDNKSAGSYTVKFDAINLASGTYFYRLESGDFRQIKKMLLLK